MHAINISRPWEILKKMSSFVNIEVLWLTPEMQRHWRYHTHKAWVLICYILSIKDRIFGRPITFFLINLCFWYLLVLMLLKRLVDMADWSITQSFILMWYPRLCWLITSQEFYWWQRRKFWVVKSLSMIMGTGINNTLARDEAFYFQEKTESQHVSLVS